MPFQCVKIIYGIYHNYNKFGHFEVKTPKTFPTLLKVEKIIL